LLVERLCPALQRAAPAVERRLVAEPLLLQVFQLTEVQRDQPTFVETLSLLADNPDQGLQGGVDAGDGGVGDQFCADLPQDRGRLLGALGDVRGLDGARAGGCRCRVRLSSRRLLLLLRQERRIP
jgi:hypothetical protein